MVVTMCPSGSSRISGRRCSKASRFPMRDARPEAGTQFGACKEGTQRARSLRNFQVSTAYVYQQRRKQK